MTRQDTAGCVRAFFFHRGNRWLRPETNHPQRALGLQPTWGQWHHFCSCPCKILGFSNPSFNTPVLSRASPSLVVLCEGLSRTRPGLSIIFPLSPLPNHLLHFCPSLLQMPWSGEERIEPSVPGGDGAPHAQPAPIPIPPHAHIPILALRVFQRVPPCSRVPKGWVLLCPPQLFLPSSFSSFFFPTPSSKHNKSPKSPANEKPLFVPLFPLLSATAEY